MPNEDFLHHHSEFADLVRIVADKQGINPDLAEKDYWVMHCLYGLQQAGFNFHLKGGTSLSKGYRIINRFSEDIDIHIVPDEKWRDVLRTGRNHDKDSHIEGRRNYYDYLAKTISIADIKVVRDADFDDEECRNGGIRLNYEPLFNITPGIKEGVLLEVGFGKVEPNQPKNITSWAFDHAWDRNIKIIDNRAKEVACYEPQYTFIEKLDAIARKYRQFENKKVLSPNFIRHYYDVYCLLQDQFVQDFIQTNAFEEYKQKLFKMPLADNQAFLLEEKDIFSLFKKEYISKKSLYYREQPDFEEIINALRQWLK